MSVPLQYATKCAKCACFMNPGTPVDFVKEGSAYVHWHAEGFDDEGNPMDGCAIAAAQGQGKRVRRHFDLRECETPGCRGSAGVAFPAGRAPRHCPHCQAVWGWEMAA